MKTKNNKKMSPLILLFIGGIILTIGDIIAAQWIRFGGNYLYIFVILFYFIGMIFLINSYKNEDIPVASIILVIFNVVILVFAGVFLFGESINLLKILGIVLCFVSIYLLEFGKKKI
jgi:multidrug transporter EmrE-like cation transporter